MMTGYNPYMPMCPCSTYPVMQYPYMACPYMMQGQPMPEYAESGEGGDKSEGDDTMYRQPPFAPGPFFGPRPPFFGPRPPFFGPAPFFPPYPYPRPLPYSAPFPGLPFLTGLALGGLLF